MTDHRQDDWYPMMTNFDHGMSEFGSLFIVVAFYTWAFNATTINNVAWAFFGG